MANSVSLIFSSAERICKRAKVDFLRRRVSILVTFPFQSLRLLTTHCSWQHRDRKIICQRKKCLLPGRKILLWGRKMLYRRGRWFVTEENLVLQKKILCRLGIFLSGTENIGTNRGGNHLLGENSLKGTTKGILFGNQHLPGLLPN